MYIILMVLNLVLTGMCMYYRHRLSTDTLTHVYNLEQFNHDYYHGRRQYAQLVLIDVDNFKTINDTSGHMAGDNALEELASHLSKSVRNEDRVYRLHGDEFAILSNGIGRYGMKRIQECSSIAFSYGCACILQDREATYVIADGNLYINKNR